MAFTTVLLCLSIVTRSCHAIYNGSLTGVTSSSKIDCFIAPCSHGKKFSVSPSNYYSLRLGLPFRRRYRSSITARPAEEAGSGCHGRYHYDLTILIPAYNERDRIGNTLLTYIAHLQQSPVYQPLLREGHKTDSITATGIVNILIIDDGSTDGTAEFVKGKLYLEALPSADSNKHCWEVNRNIKCISLFQNEGKGAAIEKGMKEISSKDFNEDRHDFQTTTRQIVLVADADGSGDMSCLNNMIHELEMLLEANDENDNSATEALIVGHRVCKDKHILRSILSWGFRTAVSFIFIGSNLGVRDTQCGFKLMTISSGKKLYNNLNLRRWTHDVEVIHRARLMGFPVGECPVAWVDAEGSKLVTSKGAAIAVSAVMLKEIALMRIKYAIGDWKIS